MNRKTMSNKVDYIFWIFTLVVFWMLTACNLQGQSEQVNVRVYPVVDRISAYHPGITHTQHSMDSWGNPQAIADAKILLESVSDFQNQHLMGWGTLNPWPDSTVTDPANWKWESLDNRISLMRETNGISVITLCASPTWMHSPAKNGQTDWNSIEKAPTADHYDDFAHLCAEVARRYPDVMYFQVWNEFKGFWNNEKNRWNYEGYTRMYNMVYDSVKAINSHVKIGGPYVAMDSWSVGTASNPSGIKGDYGVLDQRPLDAINYWLKNKKGADFICVDGSNKNKNGIWTTDGFKATQKFADVIDWIRAQPAGKLLPVWWSEWYAYPNDDAGLDNQQHLNAVMAAGLVKSIEAGYANLMIWQPQGDSKGFSFPLGIWTDTEIAGGGQPTNFYYTQKGMADFFGEGRKIYKSRVSRDNMISILASDSDMVLVNHLDDLVTVTVDNYPDQVILSPYEVRFLHDVDVVSQDDITLGSSENELGAIDYHVFPNPSTNELTISLDRLDDSFVKIELYQMNGTKVMSEDYDCPDHHIRLTVNTVHLPKGMYLLHIFNRQNSFRQVVIRD